VRNVGFIGLGQMGLPMSLRLEEAGYQLICHDTARGAREQAASRGLRLADDARGVAEASDVIFVMVPSRFVADALESDRGAFRGLAGGKILVEGGNSDPRESVRFAARCAEAGASMLDVGFSGGPLGARDGSLAVMVGGNRDAYDRARELLMVLASDIAYFGPSGSGHLAKALNHLVQGLTAQAIGEALAIASATGIDMREWTRVAARGAAGSWLMDRAREMLDHPAPDPEALSAWWSGHGARNQLSYALEAAEEHEVAVPLAALGHQIRTLSLAGNRSPSIELYVGLTWELAHLRTDPATSPLTSSKRGSNGD
jgi:2-hydroxy-3-oxopropionate reductase